MTTTKRKLALSAFVELGFGGTEFDIDPEQLVNALSALDMMMAEWAGRGARLGYVLPNDYSLSRFDQDMSVPDWSYSAIVANLAIWIAPSLGKTPSPQTITKADRGWALVMSKSTSKPRKLAMGPMLAGAGAKSRGGSIVVSQEPDETIDAPSEELGLERS
jgi:hypothetical protein